MKSLNNKTAEIFYKVKKTKPLIHHITNFVVMNDTANITLHIGALPVMAHAPEEVKEMVNIAQALVLNIGTLSKEWVQSMLVAGKQANKRGIPIVLDVVGAGATTFRTKVCTKLMRNLRLAVIKGNAGEIGVLSGAGGKVVGVESVGEVNNITEAVKKFAGKNKCTVIATGENDIISDGDRIYSVGNGHILLTTLTGTGCMSTSFVGAFCAVESDYVLASASALACFGLSAELAAKKANGPASFKTALLDSVYNLDEKTIKDGVKINVTR